MSASMSKSPLALSSSMKIEEETKFTQKQGIVTILSSDSERTRAGAAASLRRTLSADMSSKKWLSQNGLCPMKKIASSNELSLPIITDESSSSSSEEEEEDYLERRGQFDVWSSIQQDKNEKKKEEEERPGQFDIWSSIISQKENDDASKSLPQPYVHPLVKRSQNSLSEKSLQICTESLGSETGSDGFSSYSPSETEDVEEDKEEEEAEQQQTERVTLYDAEEEFSVAKYNSAASASCKKFLPRSFPPPIPSLSRQDGASVHMRPHRDNGRLVLEAVSVPSKNNFLAQRQDGRLVLTFVNDPLGSEGELKKEYEEEIHNKAEENNMEEFEEEFCEFEEDDNEEKEYEEEEEDDEIETRDIEIVMEQEPKLSNGVTNFHRLALMMNKPIGFSNRNPSWPQKFDKIVNFEEAEEVEVDMKETTPVAKSLPPRPRVTRLIPSSPSVASAAAAASFNDYEYYWRTNPSEKASVLNPLTNQHNQPLKNNSSKLIFSKNGQTPANDQQQQLLVLRENKGNYLVPMVKTCKESRRSFLFWEPYCIATS